jgi:hypothetical protein
LSAGPALGFAPLNPGYARSVKVSIVQAFFLNCGKRIKSECGPHERSDMGESVFLVKSESRISLRSSELRLLIENYEDGTRVRC